MSDHQIYKWTDTNGNIHYTDNKSDNTKADEVQLQKANQSDGIQHLSNETTKEKKKRLKKTKRKLENYLAKDKARQNKVKYKRARCSKEKKRMKKLKKSFTYRSQDSNTGGYIYYSANHEASLRSRNDNKANRQQDRINKACR